MRKTTFVETLCRSVGLCWLFSLGMIGLPAFAQDSTSVPAPGTTTTAAPAKDAPAAAMPSDPKELMLLAAKSNGLTGDDVKPWHLKASFTMLNEKGNITDQGTFEELWVSQHKYRTTITSTGFSQTIYGTENGILITNVWDTEPALYTRVTGEFAKPFYFDEKQLEHKNFELQARELGGTKLLCLIEKISTVGVLGKVPGEKVSKETLPHPILGPTYCLEKGIPALRITSAPWEAHQILRNNIMIFQGRYVPRDLQAILDGKTDFKAHLDSLERLNTIAEADFTPSPDALPPQLRINLSPEIAQSMLFHHDKPEYTEDAKDAHVSGTVTLRATIGTDGHILSLRVVNGPAMLQQIALNAVKSWVYKPYLINNKPVEVFTTINVTFKRH
jgi:TonB family protein